MDKRLAAAPRIAASLARLRLGSRSVTVRINGSGTKAVADLTTPLGLGLYRYRRYEDEDFSILRDYLRPGDVFLDCGANVGMFTLTGAQLVGAQGRVVAFEPAPGTRAVLMRNIAANDLAQVTVLPYALGDQMGELPFTVMGDGGGLSSFAPAHPQTGQVINVPVARLDACLPPDLHGRVSLIKIDVEGAELAALQGASELLRRDRPVLLVEVEDDHLRRQGASAQELTDYLGEFGYIGQPTPGPSPNVLFAAPSR